MHQVLERRGREVFAANPKEKSGLPANWLPEGAKSVYGQKCNDVQPPVFQLYLPLLVSSSGSGGLASNDQQYQ
jgi:hypothetical protein